MKFSTALMALAAAASSVAAGKVTFWTLDDKVRTIYFTASPGYPDIDPVTVSNKKKTTVEFPADYIGNYYAIKEGDKNVPGMLGEVNFGGWHGRTYFDVSAIVDANDHDNVKQMWPASALTPMSGCEVFPCNNVYWLSDDVQTKVTDETHIITTLGSGTGYSGSD